MTSDTKKGLYEFCIFCAAIVSGTACSITSKVLYDTTDNFGRHFDKPLAQTLAMFVAMILGLPLHWIIICYKLPFPGYDRFVSDDNSDDNEAQEKAPPPLDPDRTPRIRGVKSTRREDQQLDPDRTPKRTILGVKSTHEERQPLVPVAFDRNHNDDNADDDDNIRIPIKTYFYLIIPAIFDCIATALCMVGLLYLDVSIYQLLRGSGIIFVALLRQYALHQHLYKFQWVGVGWNVVSVILVGATALLDSIEPSPVVAREKSNLRQATIGIAFMLAGTLVQAMMFVFEEKVMRHDEVRVPPLLLFGMEGFW